MPIDLGKEVERVVDRILKEEGKKSTSSPKAVTNRSMLALEKKRGDGSWGGFGRALEILAVEQVLRAYVTSKMKRNMPKEIAQMIMRNAPEELRNIIGRVPAWIALGEGKDAQWVMAHKASPEQWDLNFKLKDKKGKQTTSKAQEPREMRDWLKQGGYSSMEDAIRTKSKPEPKKPRRKR